MTTIVDPHTECLQGAVDRVTFHSEESGFCVLRTKVKGQRDPITVIGNAASISAGEYIECQGVWINDKKHGLQFKAQQLKAIPPTTLAGIEKYLGSGMVKGVGPHFAKKLIRAFGTHVFDVIEKEPERLNAVEGIGKKRKECIVSGWNDQKAVREIMVFLQSHDVGTSRAVRIYKTYGKHAIEKVSANPYRLALDIRGIGFKTADQIAQRLGVEKNATIRAEAGVRHVLQVLCDAGHCAAQHQALIKASHELLDIPNTIIEAAIEHEIEEKNLVADTIDDQRCLYPMALYQAETRAASCLLQLNTGTPPWGIIDVITAIPEVEQHTQLKLSDSQQRGIETVLQHKLSIITGGPGVGKTTVINSLLTIIEPQQLSIALSAPTGRAAKRLTETTGMTAKTIHRLLDIDPQTRGFKHDQHNPLPIDVLIVDESSMIDIVLLNHLLKAIPKHAAIVFVGDIDQLPSVGSGAVLADLIQSQAIAVVRLTEIFRQAAESHIIINSHRINQGKMPLPNNAKDSDFFTLYADTPDAIHDTLIQVVCQRLPKHYHCNPISDIQVLSPMNRGGLGSRGLNIELQRQLNGNSEPKIKRYGMTFSPGDKVIQTVNNYDKEVFNGDIGLINHIDAEEGTVTIQFDRRHIEYETHELDEVSLAYAISIHKSQGSEFPIIVIPLATQHYVLLARNLLYTGITRGKKLVVLIGQKRAIGMAVNNNKEAHRLTKLAHRLQNPGPKATT